MKALNFDFEVKLSYDYMRKFLDILYPKNYQMRQICLNVVGDSFYTLANNKHKPYDVAIGCLIIGAKLAMEPLPNDYNCNLNPMNIYGNLLKEAELYEALNDPIKQSSSDNFEDKNWFFKIHPLSSETEITQVVFVL